ncbi:MULTISPECIES: glutamine amidotransferase [unclassified Phyllobacterium]|uniref:glutamine amidotransferase n=1 Tax=Phyllobacterium TaxID=28100 RepID=UPI000DDBE778|nr:MULTISPECIES: glutamine amidotransferase [unclassified Phyllobacterium]MBA8899925.1 GMP synthase (glutamine-hydrolyzing) [Phyllobacterium sp. P30BS-XVII]UGX85897.1 glutamine amidotransferase [Phyllobacterium sp. T1293]
MFQTDWAENRQVKRPKILTVLHQERSSPGRVGQLLLQSGFDLDIRRPPLGDDLPETLENHAGAVIFGGPMSANDPDEFVTRETDWLSVPLAENKPFLGICLGAQMLANHIGGTVGPHPEGLVEIGWYELEATEAGKALMDWPSMVYHFHREGFDLPRSATLLATAKAYHNQAFRYGENAWGVQFHAELTRAMMQRWVVRGSERFTMSNAQQGREHLEGRLVYDAMLKAWLQRFLGTIFGTPVLA